MDYSNDNFLPLWVERQTITEKTTSANLHNSHIGHNEKAKHETP